MSGAIATGQDNCQRFTLTTGSAPGILYMMVNNLRNDEKPSQVYLLHFDRPYWSKAQHYVGYTTIGAENRIEQHRTGKGSLLVNYAHNKKGIPFQVGMVIDFNDDGEANKALARQMELKLKREGHLSRHCSICEGVK